MLNDIDVKDEMNKMEKFFPAGFHRSKINKVSLSLARSIFATAGQDDVVRLWLYDTVDRDKNQDKGSSFPLEKQGILYQKNQDNPVGVSLHPFGFLLAVAFNNGFKVYKLLKENFFLLKEKNLINCGHIMFSQGGQYLISSNFTIIYSEPYFLDEKSTIFVYDSVYFSQIFKFELHDSRIHGIHLVKDRFVISNCTRGRVFFWEIEDKVKSGQKAVIHHGEEKDAFSLTFGHEHTKPYTSYTYDFENDLFIGCLPEKYSSTERLLILQEFSCVQLEMQEFLLRVYYR